MASISKDLIRKIFKYKLTGSQISHLLNSIRYADKYGVIHMGINYRDIKYDAGMSVRHHYNCMRTLIKLGIYEYDKCGNIIIPDNSLNSRLKAGYIKLPNFIYSCAFNESSVQVKRLILKLLYCGSATHIYRISDHKLMKFLNVNRLEKMLSVLRELSSLGWFEQSLYYSRKLKQRVNTFKVKLEHTGTSYIKHSLHSEHIVKSIFRKKKIMTYITPVVLRDFVQLLNQYKERFYKSLKFLNLSTANGAIFRKIICIYTTCCS